MARVASRQVLRLASGLQALSAYGDVVIVSDQEFNVPVSLRARSWTCSLHWPAAEALLKFVSGALTKITLSWLVPVRLCSTTLVPAGEIKVTRRSPL